MKKRRKQRPLEAEQIEKLIKADIKKRKAKRKSRKASKSKNLPNLRKMRPFRSEIAIKNLPNLVNYEFPAFEFPYDGKRGRLLRLSIGSAYVEAEREVESKYKEKYYISRETIVVPLAPIKKATGAKK